MACEHFCCDLTSSHWIIANKIVINDNLFCRNHFTANLKRKTNSHWVLDYDGKILYEIDTSVLCKVSRDKGPQWCFFVLQYFISWQFSVQRPVGRVRNHGSRDVFYSDPLVAWIISFLNVWLQSKCSWVMVRKLPLLQCSAVVRRQFSAKYLHKNSQDPMSGSEHSDPRLLTPGKTTASKGGVISISLAGHIVREAGLMASLIARFMRPTWGPSGADRTQVGPKLAPWTLLSGMSWLCIRCWECLLWVQNLSYLQH